MTKWIATITKHTDMFTLVEEQEFIGDADVTEVLFQFGWIKPYDDTNPKPPKGIADYEAAKSYPEDRFVIMDQHIYRSKVVTKTTWDSNEWELKV